jgi:arylformamidase
MQIYDISEPIEPATAVFPGDTPFAVEWVARLERGDACNVSTVRMSVHCGSHADAPLHYLAGGRDIAGAPLATYVGRCRVLDVRGRGEPPLVDARDLRGRLAGVERLLLRTGRTHDHRRFDPGFTALGPDAAREVVAAGVRLIGIDTPSMDHATSKDLPAHHVLAAADVALLENLDLSAVPVDPRTGTDYELIALPLRIVGGDSSPVRAILRPLASEARRG